MGKRGIWCVWLASMVAATGCEEPLPPQEQIEIAPADRSCHEGEACGVVETSCTSIGCDCGVAVNESRLLHYQKTLAECRGQGDLASCDFSCETPFGKCFQGACVLTDEPPKLFRRGRSVQKLCESSRGDYVGCPECPPNTRCKSCVPCACPSTHRWTSKGCRRAVQAEARDIPIEIRPSRLTLADKVKLRVHNDTRGTLWLRARCGTPFYKLRRKEDGWERGYEAFQDDECRERALEIKPGTSRPFVVSHLTKFQGPDGGSLDPGTYRFELNFTDGNKSFRHHGIVYSGQFALTAKLSSR